ncbi:hypothetical protein ACI78Q_00210 [Geodermatophilus sp. SYSU D00705]
MSEPEPNLQAAAARLAELSGDEYAALVARSYAEFAAGEGRPDPIAAHRVTRPLPPLVDRRVPAAIRARLRGFEERYGLPSDRLTEAAAFHDPNCALPETINDLMAWSSLYARYRALTRAEPTDR